MDLLHALLHTILHLDEHLTAWTLQYGTWLYVLLSAVIFAETGLVVMAFLPGDSLLFAVGALCAMEGSPLDPYLMWIVLTASAILGDALNYSIGRRVGLKAFRSQHSRLFNQKHLLRAEAFYERHGGKTIIIARFAPILRTFAPFVAGIGRMNYPRFASFNVVGALLWVTSFLALGYHFGNLQIVKDQFHLVLVGIIILSLAPALIEVLGERARRKARSEA